MEKYTNIHNTRKSTSGASYDIVIDSNSYTGATAKVISSIGDTSAKEKRDKTIAIICGIISSLCLISILIAEFVFPITTISAYESYVIINGQYVSINE